MELFKRCEEADRLTGRGCHGCFPERSTVRSEAGCCAGAEPSICNKLEVVRTKPEVGSLHIKLRGIITT